MRTIAAAFAGAILIYAPLTRAADEPPGGGETVRPTVESTPAPAGDAAVPGEPAPPSALAESAASEPARAESDAAPAESEAAPLEPAPPKSEPVLAEPQPDEAQPMFGSFEGTYLSVGASAGARFDPSGVLLGAEVSLVRQTQEFFWFGAYVDAARDFKREQTRISVGPECGWSAFGLDLGYLATLNSGKMMSGVTVRPMLTMGLVTVFGRLSHQFEDAGDTWAEVGVLVKYPFEL